MKKITLSAVALMTVLLSLANLCTAQAQKDTAATVSKAATLKKYGVDTSSDLLSRVGDASPKVLEMFRKAGMAPRRHELTEQDRKKIANAFAGLPPVHQRVLKEHLRSMSFLDSMPNTALTSIVNPKEPHKLHDLTFRAAILNQNVSEWATEKENTLFKPGNQQMSVSIEAGKLDAIFYVILHEATHIVESSLGLLPGDKTMPGDKTTGTSTTGLFTDGVWTDPTVISPKYTDSLLLNLSWKYGGKPLERSDATSFYKALQRTPFSSAYGSTNWNDDMAEYLSVYHMTQKLKQPFRIVVRNNGKEDFVYEPMKSKLVRSRISVMKQFYNSKS